MVHLNEIQNTYNKHQDSNRVLLTRENLNGILTTKLRQLDGYSDSKLSIQYTLQEPDDKGCNWSESLVLIGENKITLQVLNIIFNVRTKYNVKL